MEMDVVFGRFVLSWVVLSAISAAIGLWLTYIVIKAAIRDGIKESGLVRTWADTARDARASSDSKGMPPMRAD